MNDDKISELLEQQCKTVQICLNTLMDHSRQIEQLQKGYYRLLPVCVSCVAFAITFIVTSMMV